MKLGGRSTTEQAIGGIMGKLQKYCFWTGQYVPLHVGAPNLLHQIKVYTQEEIAAIQGQIKPPEKKNKALEKILDYLEDSREHLDNDE